MGTVEELRPRHEIGAVTWRSAILLGIGDDDTIGEVAGSEHDNELAARAWGEQQLPQAEFPDWDADLVHGVIRWRAGP